MEKLLHSGEQLSLTRAAANQESEHPESSPVERSPPGGPQAISGPLMSREGIRGSGTLLRGRSLSGPPRLPEELLNNNGPADRLMRTGAPHTARAP
ncbi:unnamed protein product [Lota lota]